jgi:hypothetical protein
MTTQLAWNFCTALASGVMGSLLVLRPNDLEPKFFRVNGIIAAVLFLLAYMLSPGKQILLPAILSLFYASTVIWLPTGVERLVPLVVLILGLKALPSTFILVGGVTVGMALVAMNVGHWYLSATKLSIRPLKSATAALICLILLQLCWGLGLRFLSGTHPLQEMEGMFVQLAELTWILFAVVGPLIMAIMTWKTVQIQSTQSATGILYALLSLLLVGQICAIFVTLKTT